MSRFAAFTAFLMMTLLLGSSLGGGSALAVSHKGPNEKDMQGVLASYLIIQESLAADSLSTVQTEAAKIAQRAQNPKMKVPAQALSHDNTLAAARSHFKELSIAMDNWAKDTHPTDVDRLYCSMVNAPWVQKRGKIKNPYYGKRMQGCGEILK